MMSIDVITILLIASYADKREAVPSAKSIPKIET